MFGLAIVFYCLFPDRLGRGMVSKIRGPPSQSGNQCRIVWLQAPKVGLLWVPKVGQLRVPKLGLLWVPKVGQLRVPKVGQLWSPKVG